MAGKARISEQQLLQLSPAVLAYIGVAVYGLYIRWLLVLRKPMQINMLHRQAVSLANASTQARLLYRLEEGFLTGKEKDVARRGRNVKKGYVPQDADVTEYRYSTVLECLIGYLHLRAKNAGWRKRCLF